MTTEEAIKTIEIALAEVESDYPEWEYPMDYSGAFKEAISVLLAKAEEEKNTALTLEELRGMDGDPVFLSGGLGWKICYGLSKIDGISYMKIGKTALISMVDYGKNFFAYRYKPKE